MTRSRLLHLVFVVSPLAMLLPFAGCASESFIGSIEAPDAEAMSDASGAGKVAEIPDATSDVVAVVDASVPFDAAPVPIVCNGPSCVIALAAGDEHYCATMQDHSVRCWGETTALPLPVDGGAAAEPGKPYAVLDVGAVANLSAAGRGTCVVSDSGVVTCWSDTQRTPAAVPDIPAAQRVFVGQDGTTRCILDTSSELVCWGNTFDLGQGVRRMQWEGDAKPLDVRMGDRTALVALSDGRLFSWGSGVQLAHQYPGTEPRQVFGLSFPEVLAIGSEHACARTAAGELDCWGRGAKGQLGSGMWRNEIAPTRVAFPAWTTVVDVSTAEQHTCARTAKNDVYCWGGLNVRGELGFAPKRGVYVPTLVVLPAGPAVANVAVGNTSSCVLRSDGSVLCWGDNTRGQLGRGSRDPQRHPEPQPVVFP